MAEGPVQTQPTGHRMSEEKYNRYQITDDRIRGVMDCLQSVEGGFLLQKYNSIKTHPHEVSIAASGAFVALWHLRGREVFDDIEELIKAYIEKERIAKTPFGIRRSAGLVLHLARRTLGIFTGEDKRPLHWYKEQAPRVAGG